MLGVPASQIKAFEAGLARIDTETMRRVVDVLDVPATFYFEGLATALRAAA